MSSSSPPAATGRPPRAAPGDREAATIPDAPGRGNTGAGAIPGRAQPSLGFAAVQVDDLRPTHHCRPGGTRRPDAPGPRHRGAVAPSATSPAGCCRRPTSGSRPGCPAAGCARPRGDGPCSRRRWPAGPASPRGGSTSSRSRCSASALSCRARSSAWHDGAGPLLGLGDDLGRLGLGLALGLVDEPLGQQERPLQGVVGDRRSAAATEAAAAAAGCAAVEPSRPRAGRSARTPAGAGRPSGGAARAGASASTAAFSRYSSTSSTL